MYVDQSYVCCLFILCNVEHTYGLDKLYVDQSYMSSLPTVLVARCWATVQRQPLLRNLVIELELAGSAKA